MSEARLTLHRLGVVHWSLGERVTEHASQAWKLIVGIDSRLAFTHAGRTGETRCLLVAPHAVHSIESEGACVGFFSEPGAGTIPFRAGAPPVRPIEGRLGERILSIARQQNTSPLCDVDQRMAVFRELALPHGAVDSRAVEALRLVAANPDLDLGPFLARRHLSATRLRHVIAEATGLTLRRHRLWHRTLRAVESILTGAPIAESALGAGFADHAHFTRAFVRFLGRTPSSIHGRVTVLASYAERSDDGFGRGAPRGEDVMSDRAAT